MYDNSEQKQKESASIIKKGRLMKSLLALAGLFEEVKRGFLPLLVVN